MSSLTWLLALLILIAAAVQYGLMFYAIRDLLRRPSVRGDNKVIWAFVILTLPFVGALLYLTMGPTSFLPRPNRPPAFAEAGRHANPFDTTADVGGNDTHPT
ncbi:MAG: PLD nuclease N-terminal domain-containing protein [Thermomicrobiales bacterium]